MSSAEAVIRVLVVDDSAFMRKAITMMLESDPQIKVIETARNGLEALEKVAKVKPDLITLDIEMPQMDGLTALRKIMETSPTPVMMVSSLTSEGASATLDALELGAVDFIPKQLSYVSLDIVKIKEQLLLKIKAIHSRRRTLMAHYALSRKIPGSGPSRPTEKPLPPKPIQAQLSQKGISVVGIGISTGGPPALQRVVPALPKDFPTGVLIVQHMPPKFTRSLADRLDGLSAMHVKEAEQSEPVLPGVAYIAPGGLHLRIRRWGRNAEIQLSEEPEDSLHRPSADVMFDSLADAYGRETLAVIMTGMGSDGLTGLRKIKSLGGKVIAQNENTCVVYGMPRAAVENGLADRVVPLDNIPQEIARFF